MSKKLGKSARSKPEVTVRNRVALNPLLGKGAAHRKSKKAIRRADKVSLRKERYPQSIPAGYPLLVAFDFLGVPNSIPNSGFPNLDSEFEFLGVPQLAEAA